jgi:hypothetical protein
VRLAVSTISRPAAKLHDIISAKMRQLVYCFGGVSMICRMRRYNTYNVDIYR